MGICALKTTPILVILSGFAPENIPRIGTFYDFFNCLWLRSTPHLTNRTKRKLNKPRKKEKIIRN